MDIFECNDTQFDMKATRSKFIYSKNNDIEPIQIHRIDTENFEIRNIDNNSVAFELNYKDIDHDIRFQYANHFYLKDILYFYIAAQSIDGLDSYIYLVNPLKKKSFHRLEFNRQIKGTVTNIFVSNALKNDSKDEHHIVTIGTLDSAIYVFKITAKMALEKKRLTCALLRSDARNSITQQLIIPDAQSTLPSNVYIVSGGSNGIIDIFQMKGDSDIENEPSIEFVNHQLVKLPSNLPIISIQCHKVTDQEVLLAISQELSNPIRISRSIEPSVSIVKFDTQKLVGKNIKSMKFKSGTHIVCKDTMAKEPFQVWTCYSDNDDCQFMLTLCEFDTTKFEFGDKTNNFLDQKEAKVQDFQEVSIIDKDTCWVLGKQVLHKLKATNTRPKGHKRQHST